MIILKKKLKKINMIINKKTKKTKKLIGPLREWLSPLLPV